jgi:hypothetical protein
MQILHHADWASMAGPGALVLAFVLGRMLKNNLRKSLILLRAISRPSSNGRSRCARSANWSRR